MLTGYISCSSWNQGYYDVNTGEYVVSAIAVYSDKLPITNAMQILTFSSKYSAKQYVPPAKEGQAGSFEDIELHTAWMFLFDAEDNYITSFTIGSQSGTTFTKDLTGYPQATKCMIEIMGGSGYRYYVNPADCTTRTDRTECSINMSYTYTDWVMTGDGARARDAADIDIPEYQVPIPLAAWRIEQGVNNGLPFNKLTKDIPEYQSPPPLAAWRIEQGVNDGFPFNRFMRDTPEYQSPPPPAAWRIEQGVNNGFPFNRLMREHDDLGAFANAHNLRYVSIPKSCKKIGRYAFRHTHLTSVTIASDCVYYDTSFPDGCVVNFYPD